MAAANEPKANETHTAVAATSLLVAALAVVVAYAIIGFSRRHLLGDSVPIRLQGAFDALMYPVVGWVIATRRPKNPIGWIFLVIGLSAAGSALAGVLQTDVPLGQPGTPFGADFGNWLQQWVWAPSWVLIPTLVVLLFPDGRLPSPRFRYVLWLAYVALAGNLLGGALSPDSSPDPAFHNPLGSLPPAVDLLELIGLVAFVLASLGSMVGLVIRFRHSADIERLQLKWFVYAALTTAAGYAALAYQVEARSGWFQLLAFLIIPLLPTSCLVAILRYRLYEIDRIINRTMVYGLLTALLVGVYAALVVGFGSLLDPRNPLVVAASTLMVAGLFRPARRRIQEFIDRRFFRRSYDAAMTLGNFASTLSAYTDIVDLQQRVLDVLVDTLHPTQVSIWLRSEGHVERAKHSDASAESPAQEPVIAGS
jgi:hypothetical protein